MIIAVMQKGKPMADLIGRQDAIDAIKNQTCLTYEEIFNRCLVSIKDENGWVGGIKDAIEALIDLPSAQPEQQWIPCSEPPTESGTYIVTAYDGTDKRVTFVKYQKTLKRWDLTGARSYWHILAYKPLPEPWRGKSNDRT